MKPSPKQDKDWSKSIKEAAMYMCAVMGCKRTATDAHHLAPRRYAENRYGAGIALCRYHHRLLHDCPWKFEIDIETKTIKEA